MSPPGIWEHLDTLSCYTTAAATVNSHRCESSKVGLGKGQKDEEKIEMKNSGYWKAQDWMEIRKKRKRVQQCSLYEHVDTTAVLLLQLSKERFCPFLNCLGLNIMLAWEFVHVHGTIIPRRAPWGCAALRRDGGLRRVKDTNKLWKFESNTTFWTTFKL